MGSYPATCGPGCCVSRCGGQPTVVSIGDDARAPVQSFANDEDLQHEAWEEDIPDWLAALSPGLHASEAAAAARDWARCAQDLRRRTKTFIRKASAGLACRRLCQDSNKVLVATLTLDEGAKRLLVEEAPKAGRVGRRVECALADVHNIWVCADSALARRVHGAVGSDAEADLACVVLIDAPHGPLGLVLRSAEAREEFLDCMAVLIAAQRLRSEPSLARCDLPGGLPPPEAQLRPIGGSLQSTHLSGPICAWLARCGEDALLPEEEIEERAIQERAAVGGHVPGPSTPDWRLTLVEPVGPDGKAGEAPTSTFSRLAASHTPL